MLREAQLRQPRLRAPSVFAGASVGVLRLGELTAQAMELGTLVEGGADRRLARQRFARPGRFVHRVTPRALDLQDLGSMHEALPAIRHQIGLRLAPPRERGGPLLGATQIHHLVAGLEHGAVDDAGDRRGHLTSHDRRHRLVEQRDTARASPFRISA